MYVYVCTMYCLLVIVAEALSERYTIKLMEFHIFFHVSVERIYEYCLSWQNK